MNSMPKSRIIPAAGSPIVIGPSAGHIKLCIALPAQIPRAVRLFKVIV